MENEIEKLVEWIRNYVKNAGADGVVIGLSGGVDSAVVAALAVKAFGQSRVLPIALPCGSDPKDLEDAERVSQHLGLGAVTVVDLIAAFEAVGTIKNITNHGSSMVLANIKARLRMIALYAEAVMLNYLVIGTGNKSELSIGYITKHGDGAVDFEPLGQFYKTEVIGMARELGLPEDICTRVPSPGLQDGVTDESEIGMLYSELDEVLMAINGDGEELYASQHPETYSKVMDMIKRSEHKRNMPPSFSRN